MKTNTKKLDKCQVELNIALDAEEMKAIVKDVENAFLKNAQIPGFRRGKAPLALVRKNFADSLKQETERAMFQRKCGDALKAENIEEVAIADVKDIKYGDEGGEYTVVVEVKPTFKLPTYKGLKIAPAKVDVADKEVDEQLARLRVAYAKYEDAKDGEAVAEGDFAQIDYKGTVDGKAIVELAPDAKIVDSATDYWVQVEEGRFLPEILDAVKGMKAGEKKEGVKAKFDKESAPEGLKGKKALYEITLKKFRRRILPDDAQFVETAHAESMEKLVASVREQLEKRREVEEKRRRENDAVEALLKKADFDVPASQVRRAMDSQLAELAQRAQYSGLSADYFKENRESILKDVEENAVRQVRIFYIFKAIAAEEKLEVADENLGEKVIEFVLANTKE